MPYTIAPLVALAERVWPHAVSFHRIDAVFVVAALAALLWSVCLYLRNWYPPHAGFDRRAPRRGHHANRLAPTFLFAVFAPRTNVPDSELARDLSRAHAPGADPRGPGVLESRDRLPYSDRAPASRMAHRTYGRRFVTAIAGVGLSILTIAALRLSLGPAPESITLDAVRAINMSPEGSWPPLRTLLYLQA